MRLLLFIFTLLGIVSQTAFAAERVTGPIKAEVLRVVDGDTIAVRALIWPGQRVEVKVRLAGVDAPELYRPSCQLERSKAETATDYVRRIIGSDIELQDVRFGKYAGRVVADIRLHNGEDLGELLLDAGLAYPPKDKRGWCDPAS